MPNRNDSEMESCTTVPDTTPGVPSIDEKDKKGGHQTITIWLTAGAAAAAVIAAVAVVCAACRYCGRNSVLLPRGRRARSEERVMIPNFLYERSASLPDIPDNRDPHTRRLPLVNISSRPAASVPEEAALQGACAEVYENQMEPEGYQESDYVTIQEIQARKREADARALSAAQAEASHSG